MEDIQIHIWELSEKTDDVNKDEDLFMVHDNISLKKVHVSKLFDYLRQDQKLDNTIAYFDNRFNKLNTKYDSYYSSITVSFNEYEEIVNELKEKFEKDKNDIRVLENSIGKLSNLVIEVRTGFKTIRDKNDILSETLNNFSILLSSLRVSSNKNRINLNNLDSFLDNITTRCSLVKNNNIKIQERIDKVKDIITNQNDDKKDEMISIIESKYDRVLSILDYYHHIHE